MEKTYLKPSVEILHLETGAFMDEWRISNPNVEYGGEVGAKRRNLDTDSTDPDDSRSVAPALPSSIWDD